jgi:hypothetical protein
MEDGIEPVKLFPEITRRLRFSNRPISNGISPDNPFPTITNELRLLTIDRLDGIGPVRPGFERNSRASREFVSVSQPVEGMVMAGCLLREKQL